MITSEDEFREVVVGELVLLPFWLFAKDEQGLLEKRRRLMRAIYFGFHGYRLPSGSVLMRYIPSRPLLIYLNSLVAIM